MVLINFERLWHFDIREGHTNRCTSNCFKLVTLSLVIVIAKIKNELYSIS